MLTYKIHFIRHGLTQGNLEGRYIGMTDLPLCESGREELERLRETCEYPAVDCVYTSPLLRAQESAEILFPERRIEVVEDLREFNFGDFENRTIAELENDPRFHEWTSAPPSSYAPGGESGESMKRRAMNATAYIFSQMMQKKMSSVAAVTHGGVIMTLMAALGLPERPALRWNVGNGRGYTVLLSTQMWMRDNKFEVYAQVPYEEPVAEESELDIDF